MRKVILTKKLSDDILSPLKETAEVVNVAEGDLESLTEELKSADAVLLSTAFKLSSELINSAPKLKVISRTGVGVDNVDVKTATEKGILVLNTPQANSLSVAEHTVTLIAAISKQLVFYDKELRNGNFKARRLNLSVDLNGKTLGIIGCGKIGRMVANKCINAFGMKVIGYDPFITSDLDEIKIYKEIEDIFKNADYISIHIPLLESTKNLVGEKLLSLMKPTAYLINTARGGIVDEQVLANKLRNKEIAGAAFDVLYSEPPEPTNPLLELDNIILTPHIAALTNECTERVAREAIAGIADYFKGKTPKFVFNKEVINNTK